MCLMAAMACSCCLAALLHLSRPALQLKMTVDFEMTGMLDGKAAQCLATLFPALTPLCLMKPRDTHEMIQFVFYLLNPTGVHNEAKIVFD